MFKVYCRVGVKKQQDEGSDRIAFKGYILLAKQFIDPVHQIGGGFDHVLSAVYALPTSWQVRGSHVKIELTGAFICIT